MVWPIMSGRSDSGCNVRDAAMGSQRGAHRWKQERANPAISGFPKPLPTQWSKRVPPQQPQVDDLIGREIRVRGGHAGIPSEATVNDDRRTKQPPPSVAFSAHIYLKLTVRSARIRRHVYIEAACVYIHADCVVTRLE